MKPSDQEVYDMLERVVAFCLKLEEFDSDAERHIRNKLQASRDEGSFSEGDWIDKNSFLVCAQVLSKIFIEDAITIRVDASDMMGGIARHSGQ